MAGDWPEWPATLPQAFERDGFTRTAPELAQYSTAVHPPVARRVRIDGVWEMRGTMRMTHDQFDTLIYFWQFTLQGGVVRFNAKLNGDPNVRTYQIKARPTDTPFGGNYLTVTLDMWRHP